MSYFDRRELLRSVACGFGGLALADLTAAHAKSPLAARAPLWPVRAKRILFLFMQGGPSHVDTFDPKPRLDRDDGKQIEFHVARTRQVTPERVFRSPWKFRPAGDCGRPVSELFPHVASHADDLCFLHSLHTEGVAHGPATLFLHTGATNLIRPSMGAWVSYGLGTENQNLPAFVTLNPPPTKGGPRNYDHAFLPAAYQGTAVGRAGQSDSETGIRHLENPRLGRQEQRRQWDAVRALNRVQAAARQTSDDIDAVVESFELAFRMQQQAPQLFDLKQETADTLQLYGIGERETDEYGRLCLLGRRLAEAGVRYIQINYADLRATPRWDQHSKLAEHAVHARAVDRPIAGLLTDLKQRGLLDDTLVWWGGEFGRTPFAQGSDGRDHNPRGFTVWLAGGGVRPGFAWGATDEFGYEAVDNKVHMHDLHATLLHLLGLDHEQLTYRYAGRDFRLTDVHGRVVKEILA